MCNIENCSDIGSLFEMWKEEHKKEEINADNEQFRESFCRDGKLDDNCTDVKILFIARESNTGGKPEVNDTFWMKSVVEAKLNKGYFGEGNKRTQTNYYNYLLCIKERLCGESSLSDCAYMNLNKRGGKSQCNLQMLKDYIDKYNNFILKEIELINPKKIVFLGYDKDGNYTKCLSEKIDKKIKLYMVYHPSAPEKYKHLKKDLSTDLRKN